MFHRLQSGHRVDSRQSRELKIGQQPLDLSGHGLKTVIGTDIGNESGG